MISTVAHRLQLKQTAKTLSKQQQQLSACEAELKAGQDTGRRMEMELKQSGI